MKIYKTLPKAGFKVGAIPYHGARTPKERNEIHVQFCADKIDCIVATIAFGMGVDKARIFI